MDLHNTAITEKWHLCLHYLTRGIASHGTSRKIGQMYVVEDDIRCLTFMLDGGSGDAVLVLDG